MKEILKYITIGLFIFIFAVCTLIFKNNTSALRAALIESKETPTFNVILSANKENSKDEMIIPVTKTKYLTATSGVINTSIISGINVTFNGNNEKVNYKVYAHNIGTSNAYLKGIVSGRITCTPGEGISKELSNKLCSGVTLTVSTSKEKSISTNNIDGSLINIMNHTLNTNNIEEVNIIIESKNNNTEQAQFTVIVPTISLIYNTYD